MPVEEVVGSFLGDLIGYLFLDLIFQGIGRLVRKIYYWLRKLITGKEREIPELKKLEKRYLYKKIMVMRSIHGIVPKGTLGTVIEVIDNQNLFVEFENAHGKPVVVNDQTVFKIKRNKVKLLRRKLK